ncbi:MAG: conjugal transfer protein TraL [Oscillospiraceae bacterium]|nr:conjugal transfer protein TraL [Oscillospiraceae bacterium]
MLEKRYVSAIAVISLAALALRLAFFDAVTQDYNNFLLPWMNEFREGGFLALRTTSSNYNLPYLYILALLSYVPVNDLYLIKILSIIFDFVLAFTMMGMCRAGQSPPRAGTRGIIAAPGLIVFAVTLFWPAFWLNSAYWAQCDSIYAAFCLLSYAAALKNRPACSVLYAGLAFSFKLQAVFFLPVFGVLWIAKKVKLKHALMFPIPYVLTSLPALFMGWTPSRIIGIYTGQVEIYSDWLTLNAPTLFAVLGKVPKHPWFEIGLALTGAFVLSMLTLAYIKREALDEKSLLAFAFAICLGVVWLLPAMHERYFYLAEVFVILFAALNPKRWFFAPPVLLGSLAGYHAYLVLGRLSDGLWPAALILLAALAAAVINCARLRVRFNLV